jgi:hypothetical protein
METDENTPKHAVVTVKEYPPQMDEKLEGDLKMLEFDESVGLEERLKCMIVALKESFDENEMVSI